MRPRRISRLHIILQPVIWITKPIPISRSVDRPSTPLPLLRTVAHECASIAACGDEDIWAFAGYGIFEATPSACPLAIARTSPVVLWTEAGRHACTALVPAPVDWIILNEGLFAWEAATRAMVVIVTSAPQPVLLLDMIWICWRDGLHGSECGRSRARLMGRFALIAAQLGFVGLAAQTQIFVDSSVFATFCLDPASLLAQATLVCKRFCENGCGWVRQEVWSLTGPTQCQIHILVVMRAVLENVLATCAVQLLESTQPRRHRPFDWSSSL